MEQQLDITFWIQLVVYAVSIGSLGGVIVTRIKSLEKKQEQHNCLMERFSKVEVEHSILYSAFLAGTKHKGSDKE